jgi:hypothetical protein
MSDYDDDRVDSGSEDDIASELTLEREKAIDAAIRQAALDSATRSSANPASPDQSTKSKRPPPQAPKSTDEDNPGDLFLREFFTKRLWATKPETIPSVDSSDIEQVDEGLEFEERYNFRHQEPDSTVIPRNPRHVEGEEREVESGRRRRRREEHEQTQAEKEELERRYAEIDDRYRLIAQENGGVLTREQRSAWVDEIAAVQVEEQGGLFPYTQGSSKGGLEKSLRILEGGDDEESSDNEDDGDRGRFGGRERGGGRGRGGFRGGQRGRGGFRGRGPNRGGFRGGARGGGPVSGHRMDTYFAHRHHRGS